MLTPIKQRKRSSIWKYFEISYAEPKMAVCLLCDEKISRSGLGKSATANALANHLILKHPEEHATLNSTAPTSTTSVHSSSPSSPSISGLVETNERKSLWDISDAKSTRYHYLIGEMIAMDNESLSFVTRAGFTRLMEALLPHYKLPSPSYMADNVIPEIYNTIHSKIRCRISQAQAISVTSDLWTSKNNESFLSFTAHWLSPKFIPEHGVLTIKPNFGENTFENIVTELSVMVKSWNIPQNKIHLLVHDREGIEDTKYNYVKCFVHSLQQVVQKSVEAQGEVLEMITAARRLVSHFKHSIVAQQNLNLIRENLDLPDHQLVQDVSSRWNSTYYLMERLLEQKQAVFLYVTSDSSVSNLTHSQWELMEQCLKLLKPFEEITKITSSGFSCISEVMPHVVILQKYLDKLETELRTPDLFVMRCCLKDELEMSFDFEKNDKYMVATLLDPRFKSNFLGTIQTEKARQKILLDSLKISFDNGLSSKSNQSNKDLLANGRKRNSNTENDKTFQEIHESFWNCFDEVATSHIQNSEMEKKTIANEIEYYLKNDRVERWVNPNSWWSVNAKLYPNLMKVYYHSYDPEQNLMREFMHVQFDHDDGFIRTLQQIVQKSINAQPELIETLAAARRIVTHFNQSYLAQKRFASICPDMQLPCFDRLIQNVSTIWSSIYYMMERLLELKRSVTLYIRYDGSSMEDLSPSQWQLIEQYIELLKPFDEVNKLTSSGVFCLSEVVPNVIILQKHLERKQTADNTPDLLAMRSTLQAEIAKQFDFDANCEFLVSTFLDPRFKNSFLGTVQMEIARQKIILDALQINCDEPNTNTPVDFESNYSPPSKRRYTNENNDTTLDVIQDNIWNCFDRVATTTLNAEGMEKSEIANEINFYLQSDRLDRKANPYNWWSSNANQYPNLIKFVKIYLSAPSSTVYSETLFSEAGLGYEEKRNNLLTNANEEKLIFIRNNLPLINFKY